MLNFFVFVDAVIIVPLIVLAIIVLLNGGYQHKRNILLAVFCVLIAVWIAANHIGNSLLTPPQLARTANFFVFFCSFTAMILIMIFAVWIARVKPFVRVMKFTLPALGIIAFLAATPLVGQDVVPQGQLYGVIFGPLIVPYGIGLVFMIILTLLALFFGLRRSHGIRKNQLQVIGASVAFSLPLVLLLNFILPSITGIFWLTEFGVMPLVILIAGVYYSVIKHRLFDIRFVVVRSVAYICVLVSLSLIYYLLAYIISSVVVTGQTTDVVSISPINILLALCLTLIFQPLKAFFDRVTNNFFYKDNYRSVDFIARLNHILTSTTDLRGLLQRVAEEIAATLKSDQAFFFLYQGEHTSHFMSSGTLPHAKLSLHDARQLDEFAMQYPGSAFLTDSLVESPAVRRLLISHKVAVLVPLVTTSGITGYLLLGEHKSGSYTKRDLNILATISSELVIAIQNALSLHEVKALNATLQQRIDVATKELRSSNAQLKHLDEVKDEFMSMASHQLRTPLTSIKGYLSMVLDGDVGSITPQQEKVLLEAFNSSERMVHLIADFLNVSRLQTGKFVIEKSLTDFTKLVRQEIDDLQVMAKGRDLTLTLKSPGGQLMVNADAAKLREVITNFIDNAIYYSRPSSKITVRIEHDSDTLNFTVTDTGIGVPQEEQSRLFNKFFRATNARKQRPDGTGVGLYLARRVITAHGGSIVFESTEGKGSVFGFRLPLAKATRTDQSNQSE